MDIVSSRKHEYFVEKRRRLQDVGKVKEGELLKEEEEGDEGQGEGPYVEKLQETAARKRGSRGGAAKKGAKEGKEEEEEENKGIPRRSI